LKHANWICQKCKHTEYEVGEIRVAGSFWAKIFNVQNKKYASLSCVRCSYTEFYKDKPSSRLENVLDLFGN
jgi:predicted nucleic-acid-binding Zn-ribbon protein